MKKFLLTLFLCSSLRAGQLYWTVGTPDNGLGGPGDWAFDPVSTVLYGPKQGSSWIAGVNLGVPLGYTAENAANKSTSVSTDGTSDVKYPSVKAVKTYADTKQAALGFTPEDVANKDTDGTLAGNSDTSYPSQKAVKTYADTKQTALGFTAENVANKDTDGTLSSNSDTKYASQKATKTYADTKQSALGFTPAKSLWVTKSTTYTAVAGDKILADTSSAAFTINLPASPAVGNEVDFLDAQGTFNTNNLTVGHNRLNISGSAADLVSSTNNGAFALIYAGGTIGWQLISYQ
jgi:hypothetical protein